MSWWHDVEWGSVGEWVGGLATVTATAVALWLPRSERKKREGEDLDEVRRVALIAREAIYHGQMVEPSLAGTLYNSLGYQHRILGLKQLEEMRVDLQDPYFDILTRTRIEKTLDGVIAEIAKRLKLKPLDQSKTP